MDLTVGSIEIACGSHGGRLEVVVAVGLYLSPQEGCEDPVEGEEGERERKTKVSLSISLARQLAVLRIRGKFPGNRYVVATFENHLAFSSPCLNCHRKLHT